LSKKRKGSFFKKNIKESKKKRKERHLQNKKEGRIKPPKYVKIEKQQEVQYEEEHVELESVTIEEVYSSKKISKKKHVREEQTPFKHFKNTTFLLDANAIVHREKYRDNISQLLKGPGNKIIVSGTVLDEIRKVERKQTKDSVISELKNLFGNERVERRDITDQMKKKGDELEKKYKDLELHSPDSHILAQAIELKAVIITNDYELKESCKKEGVTCLDQKEHVIKKEKPKKDKRKKIEKKYTIDGEVIEREDD